MAVNSSMPVLVIDDYGTMVRIIRNLLKPIGFDDVDDPATAGRRWRRCGPGDTGW